MSNKTKWALYILLGLCVLLFFPAFISHDANWGAGFYLSLIAVVFIIAYNNQPTAPYLRKIKEKIYSWLNAIKSADPTGCLWHIIVYFIFSLFFVLISAGIAASEEFISKDMSVFYNIIFTSVIIVLSLILTGLFIHGIYKFIAYFVDESKSKGATPPPPPPPGPTVPFTMPPEKEGPKPPPPPPPPPPRPEPTGATRYTITNPKFAEGGMAVIKLARVYNNPVAKVVIKTPRRNSSYPLHKNIEKLNMEKGFLQASNHSNIVRYIDWFEEKIDGITLPNLVVEYVDGNNLSQQFKCAPATENEAVDYAVQILDALEYIHRLKCIHRDLNPGNIMLSAGKITLIDFGTVTYETNSQSDTIFFKPYFQVPEMVIGYVDHRSDIYCAGGTLYFLLTGAAPGTIGNSDVYSLLRQKGLSDRTAKCVKMSLELEPNNRYQNVEAMRNALLGT